MPHHVPVNRKCKNSRIRTPLNSVDCWHVTYIVNNFWRTSPTKSELMQGLVGKRDSGIVMNVRVQFGKHVRVSGRLRCKHFLRITCDRCPGMMRCAMTMYYWCMMNGALPGWICRRTTTAATVTSSAVSRSTTAWPSAPISRSTPTRSPAGRATRRRSTSARTTTASTGISSTRRAARSATTRFRERSRSTILVLPGLLFFRYTRTHFRWLNAPLLNS